MHFHCTSKKQSCKKFVQIYKYKFIYQDPYILKFDVDHELTLMQAQVFWVLVRLESVISNISVRRFQYSFRNCHFRFGQFWIIVSSNNKTRNRLIPGKSQMSLGSGLVISDDWDKILNILSKISCNPDDSDKISDNSDYFD